MSITAPPCAILHSFNERDAPCPQCHSDVTYDDGAHDIDCKIDGFGAMKLKSEFVRKA